MEREWLKNEHNNLEEFKQIILRSQHEKTTFNKIDEKLKKSLDPLYYAFQLCASELMYAKYRLYTVGTHAEKKQWTQRCEWRCCL